MSMIKEQLQATHAGVVAADTFHLESALRSFE